MLNYSRQYIDKKDIQSVIKSLKSEWLTTGPQIKNFEDKIKKFVNAKYCSVVNSATSALHLSCLALDIKKKDYVWTTSNTFVSTANAAVLCGAIVDLVDIDKKNFNLDINQLELKLKKAKLENKLPKVIILVHFSGLPCDLDKIFNLKKKYNFKIIEDASHALGARFKNNKIGNCKFSELTVFSFHPVKMITTGEGGAVTTNLKKIHNKIQSLRSHGIIRQPTKKEPWFFNQVNLGLNYRMTDIQASLGISQLKKINFFLKERNKIASIYNELLKDCPIILPNLSNNKFYSSFHLYVILLKTKKKRDILYKKLLSRGFKTNVHYIPVYRHKFYKRFRFNRKNFLNNENYFLRL